MSDQSRPLSPHLQVYRLPLSGVMSIFHRITGVGNALGLLLVSWWLIALGTGEGAFDTAQAVMGSFFGQLLLFCWTLSVFYHLANGIRHLAWDAGYGFELPQVGASNYLVLGAAVCLTVITWLIVIVSG